MNFTEATFALATYVYTSMHKGRLSQQVFCGHRKSILSQIFCREREKKNRLMNNVKREKLGNPAI